MAAHRKPAADLQSPRRQRKPATKVPARLEPPEPPLDLSPRAAEHYAGLYAIGTTQESDAHSVALLSTQLARREEFLATLDRDGWTVGTRHSETVLHPLAREVRSLESEIAKAVNLLGLTPAARLRLGIDPSRPVTADPGDIIAAVFTALGEEPPK